MQDGSKTWSDWRAERGKFRSICNTFLHPLSHPNPVQYSTLSVTAKETAVGFFFQAPWS